MSSYSASGSPAPEGMYAKGPSQGSLGWTGAVSDRKRPSGESSLPVGSDVKPELHVEPELHAQHAPGVGKLILLEPFDGAPQSRDALEGVLQALHPDAMLSGRLSSLEEEWPSRPDVIRSELYMPQVPEDHPDYYPYRDGDNLAGSMLHADGLVELRVNLRTALNRLSRTYVGLDQLLNYDKKNRTLVLAPDIYVLMDTDIRPGDNVKSIKTWVHGVPVFVLELVSDSSLKNDLERKLRVYAKIGVSEYVVWDPKGEHLSLKLRYYRLLKGRYVEVLPERTSQGESKITLAGLPVMLFSEGVHMRVQDCETGEVYLSADDERALRKSACEREAEALRREAEALRREAEARLALDAQAAELLALRMHLAQLSPTSG